MRPLHASAALLALALVGAAPDVFDTEWVDARIVCRPKWQNDPIVADVPQ